MKNESQYLYYLPKLKPSLTQVQTTKGADMQSTRSASQFSQIKIKEPYTQIECGDILVGQQEVVV